jgi:membrane-associated phospholipid phosphatase
MNYISKVKTTWADAVSKKFYPLYYFLSSIAFIATLNISCKVLATCQNRSGVLLNDFIIENTAPIDFSLPIFIIIYTCTLLVVFTNLQNADGFFRGLQAYTLLILVRTLSIYLVPLEPPTDIIILDDPIANYLLGEGGNIVTKDLFFSGHVSALILLGLASQSKILKKVNIIFAAIVGVLIVWQHVHYTIDVIVAPVAAYACVYTVEKTHEWIEKFNFTKANIRRPSIN